MAINIPIITDFDGRGVQRASKAFANLQAQTNKVGQAVKKAFMVGAAAVAGLAAASFSAVKAAVEDQKAQALLARQLRVSTKATDAQVTAIEEQIRAMSLASGVADDELRPALATLVRGTRNTVKAQKALRVALNVSRATGKPLVKVAESLARAYGGNVKALVRLDPALRNMITKTTTADQAVGILARTFEGAASTAAETMQGKLERTSVAFSEMKEEIGVALLPVAEKFTGFITDTFIPYAEKLGAAYGADGVSGVFRVLKDDLKAVNDGATGFDGTLINLITTAALLGAGFKVAFEFTQAIIAWNNLQKAAEGASGAFAVLKAITFTSLITAIGLIGVAVYELVDALRDASFRSAFGEFLSNSVKLVANAFIGLYKVIRGGLNLIIGVMKKLPFIGDEFGYLPDIDFQKFTFDQSGGGAATARGGGPRMMAEGGIVTRPTFAMVGEAGPEAVIPLSKWGQMGGNNVTINVSGGDPQSVVDAITRWYRQNGALPVRTL